MQVVLPSTFNQPKDRKKVLKSTSNSHVGTTSTELVEGKNVNSLKGKNQNQYLNNGVNNAQSRDNQIQVGQQQQQGSIMQNPYLSLSQQQSQNNYGTNHMLIQSHPSPLNQQLQSSQNHQSLFQQQQQMQIHNPQQQISIGQGLINNNLGGGNYSTSAHQSSEKKQQPLQMQLQQMQMNKSSTSFAKFKDLFGSKRLSEANAKQFLENSNFNSIANNSANFNKSSRIIAKIQVNKMTAAVQNQNQNTTSSSTNQKSIISPKRAQIINHGYIIEDKKKKSKQLFTDIASQMPQNVTNQQYQQNTIQQNFQQQALLSGNQPYFKINRDSNKQSITASEDNHSIPNLTYNHNQVNNNMNQQFNNQNGANHNMLISNNPLISRSRHSTQSASKGSAGSSTNLVDSNQNRNIDINKLSEYKKQLESQLENVNTYIEGMKSFSSGQSTKLPNSLAINIDNLQDHQNNLFEKKMSLDEIVMISAPQSVRNTKDSNNKLNPTTQASSQYVHHSNNNSIQFFNFNNKNGVQAAVTLKDDQQNEQNGNGIKNYLSQNIPIDTKMTYSQKIFPKSTTQYETNNANQANNNQQFFLSTKSSQNKTHVKRQTLDSTFSQTLQSQRIATSNHQLSSILSQSIHHLNQNAQVGGGQQMIAQQAIPNNLQIINEQDTNDNIGLLLNNLKEKISKVLNNYKSNKESSDKLNSQLLTKLNLLQSKNSSNPQSQINNLQQSNQNLVQQPINGVYHTKSNSLQQVQQIPQQALPLRNHNNLQKSLSQSQQFFLQKNNENQQMVGHGNNQINHLINNMNYSKNQNIYQNQQNQHFIQNMNQNISANQQDHILNQNRDVLKKEYYANSQQQLTNSQVLSQHNGIQQQQILIDSTLGYNTNNNNNIIPISKNFSQSPPFSTKKQTKNQSNVIQSPDVHKQFQFYQNSAQRMTQSSHINSINQASPSQKKNINDDYMQQQ